MPVIHSAEFAREGGVLEGSLPLADLPRLQEVLVRNEGEVAWRVRGGVDKFERPWLEVSLTGELALQCQRCLSEMAWPFVVEVALTQFADEAAADEAEASDPELDTMVIESALSIETLLEDELLLALPFAPTHAICEPPQEQNRQDKPNPFAVLAGLKTRKAE
ncbi:uncharacterized protein SAMN02745857_03684 [Andreprevotia lacus DSM 23236]|jgi:uncharacterized protein|uniref:Large ribosomal RNA subunit accumulation protein YceD n=1 Tax=Andreprevotia lacus DSM 23236 TaxID=1121001 RepID=A0A1W1XZ95_9NEIS|nr:YceD family protein [Andreprevotia lacus]SMC29212.1 uncharacterized protein SAMN02745857_03684 [Andreprevotia lacus DSM 23236]